MRGTDWPLLLDQTTLLAIILPLLMGHNPSTASHRCNSLTEEVQVEAIESELMQLTWFVNRRREISLMTHLYSQLPTTTSADQLEVSTTLLKAVRTLGILWASATNR